MPQSRANTTTGQVYLQGIVAGNGGQPYQPAGVLLQNNTATGNAADTNYVYSVPTNAAGQTVIKANTLRAAGDTILLRAKLTLISGSTGSRTYQFNVGHTAKDATGFTGGANIISNATASSGVDIWAEGYLRLTSAGHQVFGSQSRFTNSSNQGVVQTGATLDETTDLNVAFGVKDASSVAGGIVINQVQVLFEPGSLV